MEKAKSTDRAVESRVLSNRLLAMIEFMEQAQNFPSGPTIRKLVEDAAARYDVRALRLICKEVDAMCIALTPPQRKDLDSLLEQFGVDRSAERTNTDREMAAILKRGTIASERERRRVEDYLALLETTDADEHILERVRRLLSTS